MKIPSYKSLPLEAKAAFWFFFCVVLQRGLNFLSTPVLTRLMPPDEFGLYSIFNAWLRLLEPFLTLNLTAGIFTNAMYKYRDRRDDYTASMHGLSLAIWLAFGAVFFLGKDFWLRNVFENRPFLAVAIFLYCLFAPGYGFWTSRRRFEYRYISMTVVTISASALSLLGGAVGAYLSVTEKKAQGAFAGYIAANCAVGLLCTLSNLGKSRKLFNAFYWKYALRFNIPLIPHYLSIMVLAQSDRIMIGRYVGNAEAGMYSFVYTISLALNAFTISLQQAVIPWQYKHMENGDYRSISSLWNTLLLPLGLIVTLVAALGPEAVAILGTEAYREAVWVVPPVALGVFFNALYSMMFGVAEFYFEANFFIMAASVSGAAANVILNAIFIPRFGYIAAAYTTLVCYLISAVAHAAFCCYLTKKHLGIRSIYDLKFVLCLSVCVSAAMFAMLSLYRAPMLRLTAAVLLSLAVFLYGGSSLKRIAQERGNSH